MFLAGVIFSLKNKKGKREGWYGKMLKVVLFEEENDENKEFLHNFKSVVYEMQEKVQGKKFQGNKEDDITKHIKCKVTNEIDIIGISPKAIGRDYLIDVIVGRLEGKNARFDTIAKLYGKTTSSVERAMQNAIDKVWNTVPQEVLKKHYKARIHSERGVPTVMEFICYYTNKLKLDMNL